MLKRTKSLSKRRTSAGGAINQSAGKARRLLQRDDENQTRCWTATEGHIWMNGYFDTLPLRVRQRLRASPFNVCPACLVVYFLPEVLAQHPEYSRERALLAAIEVMESEVRKTQQ